MIDNTKRFTNRVQDYIQYRPKYPPEIIDILDRAINLTPSKIIADIGAGTGFSTELFLHNGNKVFAVEPNDAMREACEQLYGQNKNLISINGTAEATTLNNSCIDVIVAGQAFHWFDRIKAKSEFDRILKPGGHIVLIWNERAESNNFLQEYEQMLINYGTDYKKIDHRNIDAKAIANFFNPKLMYFAQLQNEQHFDLEGFLGRIRSSSYTPKTGDQYEKLQGAATKLFNEYRKNNEVIFLYDTRIYWC